MVKKSLCLRVQRYFPKGSGIQQPGRSRVFKHPCSKNTNLTNTNNNANLKNTISFWKGDIVPNNMGIYGKFKKR